MSALHHLVHIAFDALVGAAFIASALFAWRRVRHDYIDRNSTDPIARLAGWALEGVCAAFALTGLLMAIFGVPGNPIP